jgi:hypothetical protein
MEFGAGAQATDKPAIPAVGHPAFGELGGSLSFLAPAAGVMRALDAACPSTSRAARTSSQPARPESGDAGLAGPR